MIAGHGVLGSSIWPLLLLTPVTKKVTLASYSARRSNMSAVKSPGPSSYVSATVVFRVSHSFLFLDHLAIIREL